MKISTIFNEAFVLTKKNALVLVGVFVCLFAFSLLLNLITLALQSQQIALLIFNILNYIFQLYIGVVLVKLMFLVVDKKELTFESCKPKYHEVSKFLIAFVYMMVIFISIVMVTMGVLSLLTIIDKDFTSIIEDISLHPENFMNLSNMQMGHLISIFFLIFFPAFLVYLRLQYVTYLIVDKDLDAGPTIMLSLNISKGKLGFLLLLFLSIVGLNILGLLFLGVGLFFSIPMSFVIITLSYKLLINEFDQQNSKINISNIN